MPHDRWHASVKALVEFTCRRGPLGYSDAPAASAEQGQQAQRRVQARPPPGYRKEISVDSTVEAHGITLTLSGRIDGAWEDDGTLVVEEIKSTYFHDDTLPATLFDVHQAQALCYAAMWPDARQREQIRVRVTYFQLKDETTFHRDVLLSQIQIAEAFSRWTQAYCQWLSRMAEHRRQRDAWAAALTFPFGQYRRGQRLLAVSAWRYARDGKVALLEAPTGAGKTVSLLFPALKRFAEDAALRVFYLTAKNSGQRTVQQTLHRFENHTRLLTVYLGARSQICPCLPGAGAPLAATTTATGCDRCNAYYDRRTAAFETALAMGNLDRSTLLTLSETHQVCPHQLALDLCEWADLVVGDFNYLFDPFTRQALGNAFDEHGLLLVDEAHNLPERAREMYTCTVSTADLDRILTLKPPVNVRKPLRHLRKCIVTLPTDGLAPATLSSHPPETLVIAVERALEALRLWIEETPALTTTLNDTDQRFEVWMLMFALRRAFEHWGDHYCLMHAPDPRYIEKNTREAESAFQVTAYCLDPGFFLAKTWEQSAAALLFSGTLQPVDWFARSLGLQRLPSARRGDDIAIEHALDHTEVKAALLALPMHYQARRQSLPEAARHIIALLAAHPGRYLIAAASFEILGHLQSALETALPEYRWLVQRGDSSPDERQHLLAQFVDCDKSAALVITGGVFAEGIDLADTPLRGVIQVGLPIPPPEDARKRLQEYHETHYGQGFEYTYSYPAIARTLQTCGRLLRKDGDQGCLLLIDARFLRAPYRRFLPEHWQIQRVTSPQALVAFTQRSPV